MLKNRVRFIVLLGAALGVSAVAFYLWQAAAPRSPLLAPGTPGAGTPSLSATPTLDVSGLGLVPALTLGVVRGEFRLSDFVAADANAAGGTPAPWVALTIRRELPQRLEFTLPTGLILLNESTQGQDMVGRALVGEITQQGNVRLSQSIVLADDEWHEYLVEAYSLDFEAGSPQPGTLFSPEEPLDSEVQAILEAAANLPAASHDSIQAALWAITDGVDAGDLLTRGIQTDLSVVSELFTRAGLELSHKRLFSNPLNTLEDYLARANEYYELGEFSQAEMEYSEALLLDSGLTEVYYRRGLARLQQQEFDAAIQDFEHVVSQEPEMPLGYYALGLAYSSLPDPDTARAIDYYDKALQYYPDFVDALYSRGIAYAAQEDFDQAILDFSAVLQIDPEYVDALVARGQAYGAQEKFDQAIENFSAALQIDSSLAAAYRARGLSYSAIGRTEEAASDLQRYLALAGQPPDQEQIQGLIVQLSGVQPTPAAGQVVSLLDALNHNWVQAEFTALGVTTGDGVILRVWRIIPQELSLKVPAGLLLASADQQASQMVVRRLSGQVVSEVEKLATETISLLDSQPREYYLEVYALSYYRPGPLKGALLTTSGLGENNLQRLMAAADIIPKANSDVLSIQAALWALTEDITRQDLQSVSLTPDDEVVKALLTAIGAKTACLRIFDGTGCNP